MTSRQNASDAKNSALNAAQSAQRREDIRLTKMMQEDIGKRQLHVTDDGTAAVTRRRAASHQRCRRRRRLRQRGHNSKFPPSSPICRVAAGPAEGQELSGGCSSNMLR